MYHVNCIVYSVGVSWPKANIRKKVSKMILSSEIITFYKTLRKYKDHDKCLELLVNHFLFKVSDRMSVREFSSRVEDIISHHLNSKKG